jgi:hypothetical protein
MIIQIRDSIVVSISACHSEDPGSIPSRGVFFSLNVHSVSCASVAVQFQLTHNRRVDSTNSGTNAVSENPRSATKRQHLHALRPGGEWCSPEHPALACIEFDILQHCSCEPPSAAGRGERMSAALRYLIALAAQVMPRQSPCK